MPRAPLASALATSARTRAAWRLVLEVARRTLDVEAELAGVAEQVLELELVLVGEQQVVHLPEAALRARRPRPRGRRARRAGARRSAAGGGRRSAGRRRSARAARRTTPVARPQNGHSKSPYSTSVSGASGRPADVVARRGRRARSSSIGRLARALAAQARPRAGTRASRASRQSTAASSTPTVASSLQRRGVEGQVGDQQRDREADARQRRAAAAPGPTPTPCGSRPRPSRTAPSAPRRRCRRACRPPGRARRPR